jgi:alpha-galactosidase
MRRRGWWLVVALMGCAAAGRGQTLAATPPMGWNDWAHYQCGFTAQTIVENAKALVKSGLAARGYNTVTIDDCWMQKTRDAKGDLQVDPGRFPAGMKPVADAVHALRLKFGIYEDGGATTCGGFAGSGVSKDGRADHFAQDARLFASWGVDYLKLDGCNVELSAGTKLETYRWVYATQQKAIQASGRPMVFSESAPAYFQDTPEWYDVLTWVGGYGQLWREGTDMGNYHAARPDASRFHNVLWNYAYNLPLARFQRPGNWNDPDFIIGGDPGMTPAESRSQMALWAMMSSPLILSSDVTKLDRQAVAMLGNKQVIAVDQDALGRAATLLRRTPSLDLLLKPLRGGDYAVAVLNRSETSAQVEIKPAELGLQGGAACHLQVRELWRGGRAGALRAAVAAHDTEIWRVHPAKACGQAPRMGAIVTTLPKAPHTIDGYVRCLANGRTESCEGSAAESWTVTAQGGLESEGKCLAESTGRVGMQACSGNKAQRWEYTLAGNLVNAADGMCLSSDSNGQLMAQSCGHNRANQLWSLPSEMR